MTARQPVTTFLEGLTAAEREEIEAIGVLHRFTKGATLMFHGERDERVMIKGRVKVTRVEDGREFLLLIHDPGEIIGELSFIDRGPRTATVTALEPIWALVRVPGVGLLEFHQLDVAREAGRRAAEAALQSAPQWLLGGAGPTESVSGRRVYRV